MSEERKDQDDTWSEVAMPVLVLVSRLLTLASIVLFGLHVLSGDTHMAVAWLGFFVMLELGEIKRRLRDE